MIVLRMLLFPVRITYKVVLWPLSWIGRLALIPLQPMLEKIDKSSNLSNIINSLSSSMATQRGLLLMIGSAILVLSLLTHAVVITLLVTTNSFDRNLYWLCIPFTLVHVGCLAGFTGAMLATPLGQGYKDQ